MAGTHAPAWPPFARAASKDRAPGPTTFQRCRLRRAGPLSVCFLPSAPARAPSCGRPNPSWRAAKKVGSAPHTPPLPKPPTDRPPTVARRCARYHWLAGVVGARRWWLIVGGGKGLLGVTCGHGRRSPWVAACVGGFPAHCGAKVDTPSHALCLGVRRPTRACPRTPCARARWRLRLPRPRPHPTTPFLIRPPDSAAP